MWTIFLWICASTTPDSIEFFGQENRRACNDPVWYTFSRVLTHGAIFLANCNAILLLRDVN